MTMTTAPVRYLLAALIAVSVMAPPISATAQTQARTQGKYTKPSVAPRRAKRESRAAPPGYTERLADKMPYGTLDWWTQMMQEGRLGGETP